MSEHYCPAACRRGCMCPIIRCVFLLKPAVFLGDLQFLQFPPPYLILDNLDTWT